MLLNQMNDKIYTNKQRNVENYKSVTKCRLCYKPFFPEEVSRGSLKLPLPRLHYLFSPHEQHTGGVVTVPTSSQKAIDTDTDINKAASTSGIKNKCSIFPSN